MRGARCRGGRGRGATTNSGIPTTRPIVSRDTQDGNHPNYRQRQDGTLHKSVHGYPLCNYCGVPSHKRERCPVKAADREAGLTRVTHPDRDKAISNSEKQKTTTPSAPAAASMSTAPPLHYQPWAFPWTYSQPMMQAPIQGTNNQWQQPQAMGQEQKSSAIQLAPISAAAQSATQNPCPYPTCHAILSDQHQAQEHMRMFHALPTTLATVPGVNP